MVPNRASIKGRCVCRFVCVIPRETCEGWFAPLEKIPLRGAMIVASRRARGRRKQEIASPKGLCDSGVGW